MKKLLLLTVITYSLFACTKAAMDMPQGINTEPVKSATATAIIDPMFQSVTNVLGGGTNVPIVRYKVSSTVTQPLTGVTISSVIDNGNPNTQSLNNMVVYYNGSQIGSTQNYKGGKLVFIFSSSVAPIKAGENSLVEIRSDITNADGVHYSEGQLTVTAQLQFGDSSLVMDPKIENIIADGLTVLKDPGYQNQTVAPGVTKIASFNILNSSTESITVNELSLELGGTIALSHMSNLVCTISNLSAIPLANNLFGAKSVIPSGEFRTISFTIETDPTSSGTITSKLTISSTSNNSNVSRTSQAVSGQTITVK